MKSYTEILNEHRKDAPITWVLLIVVLFLMSGLTSWQIVERVLFSIVVSSGIFLGCLWLQRYS
jgi:hypothetical protein